LPSVILEEKVTTPDAMDKETPIVPAKVTPAEEAEAQEVEDTLLNKIKPQRWQMSILTQIKTKMNLTQKALRTAAATLVAVVTLLGGLYATITIYQQEGVMPALSHLEEVLQEVTEETPVPQVEPEG
jgi:hypothetical protein